MATKNAWSGHSKQEIAKEEAAKQLANSVMDLFVEQQRQGILNQHDLINEAAKILSAIVLQSIKKREYISRCFMGIARDCIEAAYPSYDRAMEAGLIDIHKEIPHGKS